MFSSNAVKSLRYSVVGASLLALLASPAFGQDAGPATASVAAPSLNQQLVLKRRIAVGRFSNATNYGRILLRPGEKDPLADQAADMLTARLVESGRFVVLERRELDAMRREQSDPSAMPVSADTLLIGSVTEFGRRTEGKSGFLNSQARQVATATVEVRLVDTRTGQAFFSSKGRGTASVEVKEVAGFGSQAGYDSTLNDKAISAAVSDLMSNVMQKLQERPWWTDVLQVRSDSVLISGGPGEGLHQGDRLRVARRGESLFSRQTGANIELPAQPIAVVEVTGFFGAGEAEGASARIISGTVTGDLAQLVVLSQAE